jgi:uncharacterized protein
MLVVKTIVKQSAIAGMGLFADEDIKEGSPVWQYTPETCMVITREQFQTFLQSFHKTEKQMIQYFLTYTYYQAQLKGVILCLDNGRFVNHSEKPNLKNPLNLQKNLAWQYSVACRNIEKGEELTEDYRTYDSSEWLTDLNQKYHIFHYQEENTFPKAN